MFVWTYHSDWMAVCLTHPDWSLSFQVTDADSSSWVSDSLCISTSSWGPTALRRNNKQCWPGRTDSSGWITAQSLPYLPPSPLYPPYCTVPSLPSRSPSLLYLSLSTLPLSSFALSSPLSPSFLLTLTFLYPSSLPLPPFLSLLMLPFPPQPASLIILINRNGNSLFAHRPMGTGRWKNLLVKYQPDQIINSLFWFNLHLSFSSLRVCIVCLCRWFCSKAWLELSSTFNLTSGQNWHFRSPAKCLLDEKFYLPNWKFQEHLAGDIS